MLYSFNKFINFLSAIISSDLIHYDGRVVTDNIFCTSDSSIYAAGPSTKYDKKYFAERFEQEYFCQAEIGRVLGKKIILKEDPNFPKNQSEENRTFPLTVQRFRDPVITNCFLPGGYNYLNVQIPGCRQVTDSFDNLVYNSTIYFRLIHEIDILKKKNFRELLNQLALKT